jgi:hypothetical protein
VRQKLTRSAWRRFLDHIKKRQYIDAYSIACVAFGLAVFSLVPDLVPDTLKWAAILGGVGLLVLRITVPEMGAGDIDQLLQDRFDFDKLALSERISAASEIWVFAPTGVNVLSAHNCELIRTNVLSKSGGSLRVVILNPSNQQAVDLAIRQLDNSLDYPLQDFRESLVSTERQLQVMSTWSLAGSFDFRFLDYNPGFSLVVIDPASRGGRVIVEFHGFHNTATSARMHIEFARRDSQKWYDYWTSQFQRIWEVASVPGHPDPPSSSA